MFRQTVVATLSAFAVMLPLAAQQPAGPAATQARGTVSKGALAKAKEQALSTIHGNALTAANGPLSNAAVRLRDARFGRIVETQFTDKSGQFTFKADPGSYVVEMIGPDQSITAASQLLTVNSGETVLAVVQAPFPVAPYAGISNQGNSLSSALLLTTVAVASGIAAIVPTTPVSPLK